MPMRPPSATLSYIAAVVTAIAVLSAAADDTRAGSSVGSRLSAPMGPAVKVPNGHYGGPAPSKCGKSGICPAPTLRPGSGKPSNCQPNGAGCTKQF
jgi:hypothetical protein